MKNELKSNYCEGCGDFHEPLGEYLSSVKVGEFVPNFSFEVFQNDDTKVMKFSDFRGKWLVVMFYPADFTFVCPTDRKSVV